MLDIISYLQEIEKLDILINNKIIEVEQWKALALKTTSVLTPDKVQSSGSQQKMAEAIEKYIDIEHEINESIDRFYAIKSEILSKIEQLPADEYDILHRVYVQYIPIKVVADLCDRSYSWAIKLHNKAIDHLQELLSKEST